MSEDASQEKHVRPSWDEYFIEITKIVGTRSTCDRGKSGCVIVKDKRMVCSGYIGAPVGVEHCDDVGHEMHSVTKEDGSQSRHCIRTTHAEQNAICQAARFGIPLDGATLYCNMTPCYICAKMIINAGIRRVVCRLDYHRGERSKEVFRQAGVEFVLLNTEIETYPDM